MEAGRDGTPLSSLSGLILRNVPFAVVIPLGMTPRMARAVLLDGPRRPVRLGISPLHVGQFVDEIDAVYCRLLQFAASS